MASERRSLLFSHPPLPLRSTAPRSLFAQPRPGGQLDGSYRSWSTYILAHRHAGEGPRTSKIASAAVGAGRWKSWLTHVYKSWPIEQFHNDAKQVLGHNQFEGRTWKGWNHHVAVVLLACAFIATQRVSPVVRSLAIDAATRTAQQWTRSPESNRVRWRLQQ